MKTSSWALKAFALTIILVASAFSLTGLVKPAQAGAIGKHRVKAIFYQAYIVNDCDAIGAGEWFFSVRGPDSSWVTTDKISRNGPGWCYFTIWKNWWVSGGASTWFQTLAREKDVLWDSSSYSKVTFYQSFPSAITTNCYVRRISYLCGDVVHYVKVAFYNDAPTTGRIESRDADLKTYLGFPAHFVAKDFVDQNADRVAFRWYVDGILQKGKTGKRFTYTFRKTGYHEVKVRAIDSLSSKSGFAVKRIYTYSIYERKRHGECTYYAALEFDRLGFDQRKAPSLGVDWHGHAATWLYYARQKGWATSTSIKSPPRGAIVVWKGGTYGHVAIVVSYDANGVTLREMNWPEGIGIRTRYLTYAQIAIRNGYRFLGYILPWKR